jgi:hypothetical protein
LSKDPALELGQIFFPSKKISPYTGFLFSFSESSTKSRPFSARYRAVTRSYGVRNGRTSAGITGREDEIMMPPELQVWLSGLMFGDTPRHCSFLIPSVMPAQQEQTH